MRTFEARVHTCGLFERVSKTRRQGIQYTPIPHLYPNNHRIEKVVTHTGTKTVFFTSSHPLTPPLLHPPLSHVLGTGRACTFVFALFFVLYHLCYENIIHRTDGLEYLSDWTFISLGVTFGFLTAYSLSPNTMSGYPATATFTRIAHSTTWPTNVVSTTGAWYSFVFFPQCLALEGVDNYPWCYLEWYRLCEHGLNMVILFLDWNFGKVPIKRGDFGYSLLFLGTYSAWTMYLQFHTGKCPYVMFDFNSGWASVPWFNAAFVGVSGAFFLSKYLFDRRDLKREEGVGGAVLPVHAKYDAVGERDNTDEYE